MHKAILGTMAAAIMMLSASSALASDAVLIGRFQDWSAYHMEENNQRVCYILSRATQTQHVAKRGDVYVMITQRPAENSFDVVSFSAGYSFKTKSETKVEIGKKSFTLFTNGSAAWASSPSEDRSIVATLRGAKSLVVHGTTSGGIATTDSYSLNGLNPAYKAMNKSCGVTR